MRFSKDAQNAIIKDLVTCCGICEDDYDWNVIDIRVKRANRVQRHRFAETIKKLEAFIIPMKVIPAFMIVKVK